MTRTPSLIVRLADWSYRRRRLVVLLWIGGLVATVGLSSAFGGEFNMSFSTPGAESQIAQDLLEERFPARSGDTVDVVFKADDGVDDARVQADIETLLGELQGVPHVGAVESPVGAPGFGPSRVSEDGTIAYATLNLDVTFEDQMPREDAKELIRLAEAAERDGLQIELAGFAIQGAQEMEFSSEGIGLLAAVVILLFSFGSFLAMGLPILTALFGLGIATGLIALLCNVLEVPEFAPQVAAMIGIGVGIDYVLFIVTRYRASLHSGHEPREAVITAMTTSGRAVIFAGCVVIISLLGLFTMNLGFLRGLAIAASSGVLVVMLAAATLIPAVLGFVGHNIDRLKVPFVRQKLAGDRRSFSYRWSRVIQRRPWPFVVACLVGLIALALPALDLHFGFPDAGNDPEEWTTRQAYDLMSEGFGPGVNGPLLLVAEPVNGVDPVEALAPVQEAVAATEGVAAVSPPVPGPDGDLAVLFVTPTSSPQAQETQDLVDRLRDETLPAATNGTGVAVYVGGATAASIDATDYVADRLLLFIGAVIVLSFLLLMVVFRSILVPLKAAVMNILSISAAYGVIAVLVDGGWLGNLFGVTEPTPIPSFVPMMMFAILFGLSMDYEVFLLSRIREEYARTGDNAAAVADGLAHTARVITAAAAIMIAVFLAFVLGDQVFLKVIGLGLATAIFVDATIVRMILVPSTMELLGDANWWLPKWLARLLPTFHIEGESEEEIAAELEELLHAEEARTRS